MITLENIKKYLKFIWVDIFIRIKFFIGINTTIKRLDTGELLRVRNIDQIGIAILKSEEFERITRAEVLSRVNEGMTVLDIGANIGYYTVMIASKLGENGKVVAFEPNPVMIDELVKNISLNNLKNVIIENVALADIDGTSSFWVPKQGQEGHGSLHENSTYKAENRIIVKTETLDIALQRLNINKVDLIKIDTEGSEMLIFKGAKKTLSSTEKPILIFECAEHLAKSFGYSIYDVLNELVSYGYLVEQIEYGEWLAIPANNNALVRPEINDVSCKK